MKLVKFLKEHNVSLDRILNIMHFRTWSYENFTLNTKLKEEDIIYLKQKLEVENYDEIHKKIDEKRKERLSNIPQLFHFEEKTNKEWDLIFEKWWATTAYYNLIYFLIMNLEMNYENAINIINSQILKKTTNFNFSDSLKSEEFFELELERLSSEKLLLKDSRIFQDKFQEGLEINGFYEIIERLFNKNLCPYFSAILLLRFRKIYDVKISEYRYLNFPKYKKIIDFRNGKIFDENKEYPTTTSKSVSSTPHPFRN